MARGGAVSRAGVAFGALLFVPLVALGAGGYRLIARQAEARAERLRADADERLAELSASLVQVVREVEGELEGALDGAQSRTSKFPSELPSQGRGREKRGRPVDLDQLAREHPLVVAAFALDAEGRRTHPAPGVEESPEETAFLTRTRAIWSGDAAIYAPPRPEGPGEPVGRTGWIAWHWEEGLHLLFYEKRARGTVGVELDRTALIARFVGALPTAEPGGARVEFRDPRGETVYQWGRTPATATDKPLRTQPLAHPLETYQLAYFPDPSAAAPSTVGPALGLTALLLALSLLGLYVWRERSRALREAEARMSFVTQVSHELKTPLTNIRLYAELLGDALEGLDDELVATPQRHLSVIQAETQRLSRLIHDVLGFSRRQSGRLEVHRRPELLGPIVAACLEQFEPLFRGRGIEVRLSGSAPEPVELDRDAIGQVLSNLLSNAEKYAGRGPVDVTLSQDAAETVLAVRDEGPGIPAAERERVFEPFYRLSNRVRDGVAGTGIGLTIARALAELHGGSLVVEPAEPGARFILRIPRSS